MPRDHRRGRRGKRGFRQVENRGEDEETVDDLAHAAQFALFPAPAVAEASVDNGGNTKEDDDNEIEVSEEDDDDDDSDASIENVADKEEDSDGSSSSDEESDEDLAEALERMERASAEEEAKSATTSNPPKTENEVDGYKVPIQELESQLQMQLTVEVGGTNASTKNGMDISTNEVSLAGKLKNYMLLDRTVVVESISNAPSSQNAIGPLDEGSLLVVKNPNGDQGNAEAGWIPLGRIFEVFGPVSQPLYTIRLPSPPKEPKKTTTKSTKTIPKNSDPKEDTTKEAEDQNDEDNSDKTTPVAEAEGGTTNSSEIPGSDEQKPTDPSQNPTTESENADASSPNTAEKNTDSMVTDETPNDVKVEAPLSDPWAKDGAYAKFLSENRDIEVYYIQDEAKIIDTGLVLRTSGKGCDASNIYDEEIMDASEAYYSDDEKEREAKNKKKGNRKKKQQGNNGNRSQGNQHRPRNFHPPQQFQHNAAAPGQHFVRPPPPPPPPHNYGYNHPSAAGSLPSGFHPVSQQGGFAQQPSTLYQYPTQSAFRGQSSMPPPPPPPPQNQHYSYQGTAPASSMPPPPPPPRNPNEPPAYQY